MHLSPIHIEMNFPFCLSFLTLIHHMKDLSNFLEESSFCDKVFFPETFPHSILVPLLYSCYFESTF